ncbi:DUF5641 domain-containing protein [Nephila pilipes]|uniref:DUF5641 domain-containing protein n=1 Tax=Nephila pilipes TaxID=299642 RepID=A0A8X6NHL0_NEPPI|nr:DUF5641 domain-containing protein [Nephila pilipes]
MEYFRIEIQSRILNFNKTKSEMIPKTKEVRGEEIINLARTGFASHQNPGRKEFQNEQLKQSGESSTASALVSLQKPAYLPEIYSKESVDGELGGEESNSNNVTDIENNVMPADAVIVRKFTTSGRPVKASKRLDLLNNVCCFLETPSESQGGIIPC